MKEFVNVFPDVVVVPRPTDESGTTSYWYIDIYKWAVENDITILFKNQWQDDRGAWARFEIEDETQRFWFILKWK